MKAMQVFQIPSAMIEKYSTLDRSKRSSGFTHIPQIMPIDGYNAKNPRVKVYVVIQTDPYNCT